MRPMTLFESSDSTGKISLKAIFDGDNIEPFLINIDILRLIDLTIRGGWPETLNLPLEKAGKVATNYINAIVRNELFREDQPNRNKIKLRRLLRSLARNNATTAAITTLSADVDGDLRRTQNEKEIQLSRVSVADYIKDLTDIFIIEEIPPWNPEIRSKTIMRQSQKRVFVDPSLAIAALRISRERLKQDLNTFGFMFENLCLRDLAVYAGYYEGSLYHYRDNSDLEVDAIIEMPDGSWGAFEVKLGEHQVDTAAATLIRFKDKMVTAGANPPECMAIITGSGIARLREDGVYVVPITALRH